MILLYTHVRLDVTTWTNDRAVLDGELTATKLINNFQPQATALTAFHGEIVTFPPTEINIYYLSPYCFYNG